MEEEKNPAFLFLLVSEIMKIYQMNDESDLQCISTMECGSSLYIYSVYLPWSVVAVPIFTVYIYHGVWWQSLYLQCIYTMECGSSPYIYSVYLPWSVVAVSIFTVYIYHGVW